MATPRLTFLYPFLFHPAKANSRNSLADKARGFTGRHQQHRRVSTTIESQNVQPISAPPPASILSSTLPSRDRTRSPPPNAGFKTSSKRPRPDIVSQRYGNANEPPPHLTPPERRLPNIEATPPQRKLPEPAGVLRDTPTSQELENQTSLGEAKRTTPSSAPKDLHAGVKEGTNGRFIDVKGTSKEGTPKENVAQQPQTETALSTILRMDADGGAEKPPHLTPPPYVHHLDTFTVVSDLGKGGFSEEQAVTIMKLMRIVLAENIELARDGILSHADAEMAAYLFRAASSELRHEIRNNRQIITERMRSERAQLQHEVDILAQKLGQGTSTLKDDIKGMFDDRKLAVRVDRRNIENGIQELNYRITTRLQSEMRSEVEGLRWALVQRTAFAIGMIVFTAFIGLRISQMQKARDEKAALRRKQDEDSAKAAGFLPLDPGSAARESPVSRGVQTVDDVSPQLVTLG